MWPFPRKTGEELDMDTAGQMLNHVLDVCNYEHASVPIEVLSSYSRYRSERYALQRGVIMAMLVLFLLLPLLFITPTLTLSGNDERLILQVDSLLSVQSVTAALDGKPLAVYDAGGGSYVIQPTANGQVTVSVRLVNRQLTTATRQVTRVDADPPVYVDSSLRGNELLLFFSDDCAGLDTENIRLLAQDDETALPCRWDHEQECVVIAYPETVVHLYVPDKAGHVLHLMLTPQG